MEKPAMNRSNVIKLFIHAWPQTGALNDPTHSRQLQATQCNHAIPNEAQNYAI